MDTHKSLNVGGAIRALTELERAEQNERRVLMASMAFFWSVVCYILWCRIFNRIPLLAELIVLLTKMANFVIERISMLHVKIIQLEN
jgi:hypothetical protein